MANQKHVEILEQGPEVWNNWYEKNPDREPDFSGANLNGADFKKANLRRADFSRAYLCEVDLCEADLYEADLSRATLSGANLTGANFSKADLNRADFSGAKLSDVNFNEANLNRSNLSGINLGGANLEGANLNSTNLRGTYFQIANLRKTDLREADLREADLRKADLGEANLGEANLIGADLREANITGAVLFLTLRDNWKIDGIKCDYVFWDSKRKERTPKDRDFRPGEFEEKYKWRPLDDFERLIEKSIEFPEEYFEAGKSVLNYFGTVLRKKYPDTKATVQIKQDGLKVTMIVDPAEGKREIVEKILNDYGLVITGKMTPEKFTDDKHLIIELKSELRIAQVRIEMQKELLQDKSAQVDKLLALVGSAIQTDNKNQPVINISPVIEVCQSKKEDNTVNAGDIENGKIIAGKSNKTEDVKNGDTISVSNVQDVAFAKDRGKAEFVKNSSAGVIGDNASADEI